MSRHNTTEKRLSSQLALLRAAVGLLGEESADWWSSSFCGSGGTAFLAPVLPRTYVLAQLQGVTAAAASLHDQRIGVGEVFHLFRLPEDMEQALQAEATSALSSRISEVTASRDAALDYLSDYGGTSSAEPVGPTRMGSLSALRDSSSWQEVAKQYLAGFRNEAEVFPFFSVRK